MAAIVGLESLKNCPDYNQHKQWIPISSFDKQHLPSSFINDYVEKHLLLKSKNVVRIIRKKNSAKRPCEYNYDPDKATCGSGTCFITDDLQKKECPLPECADKKSHTAIVNIQIVTAPHVIFDDLEASAATIEFFFDSQDRKNIVEAQGLRIKKFMKEPPRYCIMECVCHDLSLLDKLRMHQKSCQHLLRKVQGCASAPSKKKLLIFIAHPHGLAKHIAIGELQRKQKEDSVRERLSPNCTITQCHLQYSAPGCLGSGGGSLIEVGSDGSCYTFALHMGKDSNGNRISGLGWTAD